MSERRSSHRKALALSLLPPLALAGLVAAAAPKEPDTAEPASVQAGAVSRPAAPAAGLRVIVDPETGEIVDNPSFEALERLSEGTAAEKRGSAWLLREFPLASGGRGVFLDGWADHSLRVVVDADGNLTTACALGVRHGESESRDEGNLQ